VAGNHLRGNVHSSTFRRSLAALLTSAGEQVDEEAISNWMQAHLRVAVLPVPGELVPALETRLVTRADPPLNLAGAASQPARAALSRLRGLLPRRGGPDAPPPSVAEPDAKPAPAGDALAAFERRVRQDVDAMVRSGYRPALFQRMLAESGAVGTAQRLLASSSVSDGFRYLWEHGMLRHSIEDAVLDDEFADLFTEEERAVARQRLFDAGHP
jgi:hypothetical protein